MSIKLRWNFIILPSSVFLHTPRDTMRLLIHGIHIC